MALQNTAPVKLVFLKLTFVKLAEVKSVLQNIPFWRFAPLMLILLKSSPEKLCPAALRTEIQFDAIVAYYKDLSFLLE